MTPQEILQWGLSHLPSLYQTTAFGLTGVVAIDMLSRLTLTPPPLLFFDTFYHFPETYDLVERIRTRYDVNIEVWMPEGCSNREEFEAKYGEKLWETDDAQYDYVVKVEPAHRAYKMHSIQSVITGRRASQGGARANLQPLEIDSTGLLKLNPLCFWSYQEVERYAQWHSVPVNALLSQGYRSIGDRHSTEKPAENGDERSGRWKGTEKTECGLHVDYFKVKFQAKKLLEATA
jgi:phosphoadenosine phosphosulfate reductase